MTVIDQYILDHYNEPVDKVATKLGLGLSTLYKKKIKLESRVGVEVVEVEPNSISAKEPEPPFVLPTGIQNEMFALAELIRTRQTGWAVDIATQRLKRLQNMR